MKLINILVQENFEWPGNVMMVHQDYDGQLWGWDTHGNTVYLKTLTYVSDKAREFGVKESMVNMVTREQYEAALAASKNITPLQYGAVEDAWDGAGLPPVGCECEFIDGGIAIGKVKVLAHDRGVVVYKTDTDGYHGIKPSKSKKFRPIRSEADKKRAEGVIALSRVDPQVMPFEYGEKMSDGSLVGSFWYELYDAIAAGKIPGVKLED